MSEGLFEKLTAYPTEGIYPFHMPGHKRIYSPLKEPYEIDITEIPGFDNLHHPEGIIKTAQERAARLYGAGECRYLVNGSTCGILAAISASAKKGGKILMARNSHKSAYHAVYLRELTPVYLYPELTFGGIQGSIRPGQVAEKLEQESNIQVIYLTSPTYDGMISDVKGIAEIAHRHHVPLIVDEAHGAHFGLWKSFPENAVTLGADAAIVSLHKTLPSLTQTALLLLRGNAELETEKVDKPQLINSKNVDKYLDIYETSSPSYVLMASVDKCIRLIEESGAHYFSQLDHNLDEFYNKVKDLRSLYVLREDELDRESVFGFDRSKILIFTGKAKISGTELAHILKKRYRIQVEMACSSYVMALCSLMDSRQGFVRLAEALLELDSSVDVENTAGEDEEKQEDNRTMHTSERAVEIHTAVESDKELIPLSESAGRVSGSFLVPYPPGIPEVVPGERISAYTVKRLTSLIKKGIEIEGISSKTGIEVVK